MILAKMRNILRFSIISMTGIDGRERALVKIHVATNMVSFNFSATFSYVTPVVDNVPYTVPAEK